MLDYRGLAALLAVVRAGSFEGGAMALHVTPSAISQRIKGLEERVGAVLVVRGQPCVATALGRRLCRHAEQVGMLEAELAGALPGGVGEMPWLDVPVAVNADSLATWFLPAARRFMEETGVLLAVSLDDQDHTAAWLRRGEVLAAVTSEASAVSGCDCMALGWLRFHAVATPDFVGRYFAAGVTRASLACAPSMVFNQKDRLQEAWVRRVAGGDVPLRAHRLPSAQAFRDGALLGLGWGMNPDCLIREDLAAGRLVELCAGAVVDVPLYWQVSRASRRVLSALTEAVLETGRGYLHQA